MVSSATAIPTTKSPSASSKDSTTKSAHSKREPTAFKMKTTSDSKSSPPTSQNSKFAPHDSEKSLKNLFPLTGHAKLKRLELASSPTTDEGCELLGSLPSLAVLSLKDTKIGDQTIRALQNSELHTLYVERTSITYASGPNVLVYRLTT